MFVRCGAPDTRHRQMSTHLSKATPSEEDEAIEPENFGRKIKVSFFSLSLACMWEEGGRAKQTASARLLREFIPYIKTI